MKRFTVCIMITVLVVAVALALAPVMSKKALAHRIEQELERATGFQADVGGVDVELWKSRATLTDIRLHNAPGFESNDALAIKSFYVRYKLLSLLTDTVVLPEVTLHVDHVTVERNPQGETNLDHLMGDSVDQLFGKTPPDPTTVPSAPAPFSTSPAAPETAVVPPPAKPENTSKPAKQYRIEALTLKLDQMDIRDYAQGGDQPMTLDLPVQFHATYEDVTDLDAIAKKVGMDLAIQAAPSILGQGLISLLGDTPEERQETLKDIEGQVKDFLKQFK